MLHAPDTHLHTLRHAQSVANINWRYISGRSNESPLTDLGVQQSEKLGDYLGEERVIPDVILSSPADRALMTARYSLSKIGISDASIIVNDALQELDQGKAVGLDRDNFYDKATLAEIDRLGKDFKAEDGESMNEVGERMLREASTVADHYARTDRPIVILFYTHSVAIRCLASTIHGWSQAKTYETEVPNASDSLFVRVAGAWSLRYIGRETSNILD